MPLSDRYTRVHSGIVPLRWGAFEPSGRFVANLERKPRDPFRAMRFLAVLMAIIVFALIVGQIATRLWVADSP